jgi:hypothetical protein
MDQVPRYFETEPKTTIISKGSREVLMKKGGTSHKRFTVTFAITGDGKFLFSHILFSNLKNKPTIHADVLVDVNKTGMWNPEILLDYVRKTLLTRVETSFLFFLLSIHMIVMSNLQIQRSWRNTTYMLL